MSKFFICDVYMSCFYSRRPDAQLFERQQEEEQQLNRELPDDILRRQLINNLAKHVLFSEKNTASQPNCRLTQFRNIWGVL